MGNSLLEEASSQDRRVAHLPAKSASVTESTMGFCEGGDLSGTGSVSGLGNPLTFETTIENTQKLAGVSVLENGLEATPKLDAWCNNFVAASHSASSESTLSVEPKRSLSKKIKELLSPKGITLFTKEMPAAPGFGCETAHFAHVPKNLKRQENKHAVHFQATKKWSKLLKKVKLLKKHKSCYLQGSVCDSEECPVKSRKVRRHSANRALRRFKVAFAFRVGCKPVSVDLVNVHVPDYEEDDAVLPEVTTLACEHLTKECDREKSSTKRPWDSEQTSTQAKRRKLYHASNVSQTDECNTLANTDSFEHAPEHEDPEIGLGSPEVELAGAKVLLLVATGLNLKDRLRNGTVGSGKSLALVIYKPTAPTVVDIDTRLAPFVTEAIIPVNSENRFVPFFETKQVLPVVSEIMFTPVSSGKELILVSSEKRLVPFEKKRNTVTSSESRRVPLGKVISLPKEKITISMSPERRLVLVSPEKRLVQISAEKQVCSVTSEKRLVLVSSENRLVSTSSERRLILVSSEKRLVSFSPKERLSPACVENRLILVSSEKRLVLYSPKPRLGPAYFVKRPFSISVENTILVPQEDSVPTNSVASDTHGGFVEILSENDFPVRKVREPKLKKWLRKPKSQLWVALELDAILVPELDKNTFRLKYLDLKLKVACKSEIERDFSEYLVYLRLLLNIESPEETARFEDLGYTVIEAQPAPSFVKVPESFLKQLVYSSSCTLSLSQIRNIVQSTDDLIDHLKRRFLDQFVFHDKIEDYLLTLMKNLQFTGGTLVKICTDMAGKRRDKSDDILGCDAFLDDPLDYSDQEEYSDNSDALLDHYERRLCAMSEELEVLEEMDQKVKKSISEMISGQKSTMANILQGYNEALGFKKKYQRQFHKVWSQEEGYVADWELDDEIGCTNTTHQERFIDECIDMKAIDVLQRKVDRTKGLYRIVSAARKSVQRQCEEVSSRFLRHVYMFDEDD